ncbi:MAG: hypothetical protein M1831_004338 [Alyxoria varia]|nr:MAG: hypothetical protein M1831_004338 [Alyxoria varia]
MSLNGLDTSKVFEAYQATLSDPGAWQVVTFPRFARIYAPLTNICRFLLHYTSRDEVDIFAQGTKGLAELQVQVAQYTENSPLYGCLSYRRRKVLLKYTPEGTSRLLLARTSVHFQAISDRFSPHDALFQASSPDEFNDSNLSSVCSLHTSSSLRSNSSSARQKILAEITETAEETLPGDSKPHEIADEQDDCTTPRDATFQGSALLTPKLDDDQDSSLLKPPSSLASETSADKVSLKTFLRGAPSSDQNLSGKITQDHDDAPSETSSHIDISRNESIDRDASPFGKLGNTSEIFKYSFAQLRPKTKLFPRPVADGSTQKIKASISTRQKLPPGVRPRGFKEDEERQSSGRLSHDNRQTVIYHGKSSSERSRTKPENLQSIGVRDTNDHSHHDDSPSLRPSTSSVTALPSLPISSPVPSVHQDRNNSSGSKHPGKTASSFRSSVLSPEKQRLMKALQNRKKQQHQPLLGAPESPVAKDPETVPADDQAATKTDSGVDVDVRESPDRKPSAETNDASVSIPSSIPAESAAHSRKTSVTSAKTDAPTQTSTSLAPTAEVGGTPRMSRENSAKQDHRPPPLVSVNNADAESQVSDDELLKELQDAKVEEARSLIITPSPSREVFTTPKSSYFTTPDRARRPPSAGVESQGKVSAITINPSQNLSVPQDGEPSSQRTRKANVSSGISRRIQALASMSSGSDSRPATSFESAKSSRSPFVRTPQRLGSSPSAIRSQTTENRPSSPTKSMHQFNLRKNSFESHRTGTSRAPSVSTQDQNNRRDSLTATAHIIRKHSDSRSRPEAIEEDSSEFEQGPVTFSYQTPAQRFTSRFGRARSERAPSVVSSSRPSSRDSNVSGMTMTSIDTFRPSGKGQETRSRRNGKAPNSGLDKVEEVSEKNSSRASKLFKRLSSFSPAMLSKSTFEPAQTIASVTESDLPPVNSAQSTNRTGRVEHAGAVGDLNVQLPDTLLWKRRWVEVDSAGSLVLGVSRTADNTRGTTRKYHLSGFRQPKYPSHDQQELPHSIVLEFVHGGSVQLACEDAYSQSQVLQRLLDAHHAWSSE